MERSKTFNHSFLLDNFILRGQYLMKKAWRYVKANDKINVEKVRNNFV